MSDLLHVNNMKFPSSLTTSLIFLWKSSSMCDVTLVCDDGQISAHKLVLAATSTFFNSVFKQNLHPHPLLYLRGVKIYEIKAILNYAYTGGAQIAEKDLSGFLAVAQDLR